MTVLEIDNKIIIKLTHIEALTLFGNYRELSLENSRARLVLYSLIKDVVGIKEGSKDNGTISVKISIKKEIGCEITLSEQKNKRKKYNEYIFSFYDIDFLTRAMEYLYKFKGSDLLESHLYKLKNEYRLILKTENNQNLKYPLIEFGKNLSKSPFQIEYTTEYGKPIILENAVFKYKNYF